MNRIQKIFDLIAGVSQIENERIARARQIFGHRGHDVAALAKPACWRRKPRVGHSLP